MLLDGRPSTPRTKHFLKSNEAEQRGLQLMSHMSAERMTSMRLEFDKRGGSIDVDDFVRIMIAHLPEYLNCEPDPMVDNYRADWRSQEKHHIDHPDAPNSVGELELVANLIDLFKEIDINGDGDLEWDEFTSFVVHKANVFKQRYKVSEIDQYHPTEMQHPHRHKNHIDRLHYINKYHQVAAIEQHSPVVTLYNARNGAQTGQLKGHRGVPMAMQVRDPTPPQPPLKAH
jgi:hypothetical protein